MPRKIVSSFLGLTLTAAMLLAAATATAEDWRKKYPELTFGVASVESLASTAVRWDPLGVYLTKTLGVPTKMRYASEYAGIIEALRVGQIQGAHMAAAQYAVLFKASGGNAEALAKEINADGAIGYQSIVIVRTDSPFKTIEDLKGHSLAFPDPNSTSGYMVPFYHFSKMGYMKGFFSQTGFSGNHEQGVLAVVNRTYDAATTFRYTETSSVESLRVKKGMIPSGAIRTIWQSGYIPNGPLVVRKELPAELKAELGKAFLSMPDDVLKVISAGLWKGWEKASHEDYAEFLKILEANEAARRSRQ
jgi:phosphonate transport system substrate-binding protein